MEYTYEEVMTALRNADAAGDSEAATRLAEIASSMMSQPEEAKPTEQPEETSMLDELGRQIGLTTRGAISGVTAIPGMVSDAATTLVNMGLRNPSLTPTAIREKEYQLPLPSQAQQQLMTRAGLPEPQNQLERAVQSGVGAMTGVGAEAALAKAVGSQALAPLTQQLGAQTAAAGVAAPVATMVSEDVAQSTESPLLSIAAGIAAGVMAGGATAKAIKMGQPVPTPVTIEDVRKQATEAYTQVDNLGSHC
jgi:hypothetical protein